MTGNTVLAVEDLHKSFGGIHALRGVTFNVPENSIVGLIGPNGCGKSTTFNTITGMIPPDSGSIMLYGKEVFGKKPHEISHLGIARTFQTTRLWRELTVIENLMIAPKQQRGTHFLNALWRKSYVKQEKELLDKAYDILNLLEIEHMAEVFASELSGGQSKLVDIGRVLMSGEKFLMLDEPVAGVAGPLTEKIFHTLKKLRSELDMTILVIEHNMDFILREGVDLVIVMSNGRVLIEGTPDEVRKSQAVIDAYLGE